MLTDVLRHPERRAKAAILSLWFFVTIANLWLLKPVRTASLLAHLGARETPWVRLGSVVVVALVVFVYSRVVDRVSRLSVAIGANVISALTVAAFWLSLFVLGEAVGATRPFVWAVYVLVDIYAVVIVGIFWTYTNDIVTRDEADALYGPVGLGGIIGGVAGGVLTDVLAKPLGTENLLVPCAIFSLASGAIALYAERRFKPSPRPSKEQKEGLGSALEGVRCIARSRYLLLVVAIVVAYEFIATLTDFATNIVFEQTYHDKETLAKMSGRLGWIASGVAIASQLFLVPIVLRHKKIALQIPPLSMAIGATALFVAPVIGAAFLMGAADRGLNYSLQQSVKETLYVPLSDDEKYKAKAAIDMVIDRAAKSLAALVLVFVIAEAGLSVRVTVAIALAATIGWFIAARELGKLYAEAHLSGSTRDLNEIDRSAPKPPMASLRPWTSSSAPNRKATATE